MAGIYVHIPFCKTKCYYCDFYSVANHARMAETVDAICREITLRRDFLTEVVETLYIGGGTPSLCSPSQIAQIAECVRSNFDCSQLVEFTLEANPEQLSPSYLAELKRIGVNRLSIGVQSLSDRILKFINRKHSAAQAVEAIANAQRAGFENISADLIYAIPGLTDEEVESSLAQLIALGVQHISAYHLGIEQGTVFGRRLAEGAISEVSEQVSTQHYELVCRMLRESGFEHYEISNFARPTFRSRHNSSYWRGIPYLGVGPAAHSFDGQSRYWNVANVNEYLTSVDALTHIEGEHLTQQDIYNEHLMIALRTAEGVNLTEFRTKFGAEALDNLLADSQPAQKIGNIIVTDQWLRIPEEKFLISDSVIAELFLG